MDIKIDLLQQSKIKNKFALYGLTIVVLLMIFAEFKFADWNYEIEGYKLIIPVFWTIWGISALYQIFTGKKIESIFGKAYIDINKEFVKYKPSVLSKEKAIKWENAKKIDNKPTYIEITDKNNEVLKIDFKHFEYLKVVEIKKFVSELN